MVLFNLPKTRRNTRLDTRSYPIELGGLIKFTVPSQIFDVLEYRQLADQQKRPVTIPQTSVHSSRFPPGWTQIPQI